MQILLKQAEIITALKQYIAQKGIDLAGKDVTIIFTSGRKENGISADLVIEDADIPGFSDEDTEEAKPTAVLAVANPVPPVQETAAESPAAVEEPDPEVPVAKTNSLFSS